MAVVEVPTSRAIRRVLKARGALVGQEPRRGFDQLGTHGLVVDFRSGHLDRLARDSVM